MKKLLSFFLALCLSLSLAACNQGETGDAVDLENMTEFEKEYLVNYEPVTEGEQYDAFRELCDNASYFLAKDRSGMFSSPIVIIRLNEDSVEKNVEKYDELLYEFAKLVPPEEMFVFVLKTCGEEVLLTLISGLYDSASVFYGIDEKEPPNNSELASEYKKAYKKLLEPRNLNNGCWKKIEFS